jgi:aldose sugar dehydrogenase
MSSMLYVNFFALIIIIFFSVLFFHSVFAITDEVPKYTANTDNNDKKLKHKQVLDVPRPEKLKFDNNQRALERNFYSNPPFIFFDNQSAMISFGIRSFWKDQSLSCAINFKCETDFSTGWNDKSSFRVATTNNVNHTRAMFYGKSLDVIPQKQYELVSHMKLNKWAAQSRVVLEGFDQVTRHWNRIKECPAGVNGPINWKEYNCYVIIPKNTTKIRTVLNAGWSSNQQEQAVTWFDTIYFIKVDNPFIFNANLKAELVFQGLNRPTSMEFLGPNDILVTEKNTGKVIEIKNGTAKTILDLNVANLGERGLLGIAISPKSITNQEDNKKLKLGKGNDAEHNNNSTKDKYVFLYFTEAKNHDGDDEQGNDPIGNRLYRYELTDNSLTNPKLLLDLPAGFHHNGGKILNGHDKDLYIAIGELDDKSTKEHKSNMALNYKDSSEPNGRGGILRLNQDGDGIDGGIIGKNPPLNKYFAYGIRNSFGMDFDPLTGKLWDTENGPSFGDEINLVGPGFNSGWRKVQGMWTVENGEIEGGWLPKKPSNLVDFDNKGIYSPPELTWNKTVGPTAIKFLTTDKLGKQYKNDLLVSDVNGRVYHFDLNKNRTSLILNGHLKNKAVETNDELNNIVFFEGFGRLITDLDIGPDGYLYVLDHAGGKIYRISSNTNDKLLNYLDEASRNRFTTN